jgi:hypothetical protein|tara:strand:+ start:268 stop:519 length:252 start_codon:yes stop_codon:yes gene_type:complete
MMPLISYLPAGASSNGCAVYKQLRTMATVYPDSYFARVYGHDPLFKGFSLNEHCQSDINPIQKKEAKKPSSFFIDFRFITLDI